MKKRVINSIGIVILIALLFGLWSISYQYRCSVSLIFPLIVLAVIGSSFIEIKIQKRECLRECFFEKRSFISRILANRIFIVIIYTLISIAMTISTIYLMLDYTGSMLLYLIVYTLLLMAVYRITVIFLRGVAREKYLLLFSREAAIHITAFLSMAGYFYLLLYMPLPGYLSTDLNETIRNASGLISSDCLYMDYILRLKIELDSALWWLVGNSAKHIESQFFAKLIWISFATVNALAILGINRFIIQIIYLQDTLSKNEKKVESK